MNNVDALRIPKNMNDVWILAARRTPCGSLSGKLAGLSAPALGAVALRGALSDAPGAREDVEEVLMGCVLPAGIGQAPARQAARAAEIPDSVPASTVNKMCGSGMKTVMMACDAIASGRIAAAAAGGMESMSCAPHLLSARSGLSMGKAALADHMFRDGLQDAYSHELMGVFAQRTADDLGFSREVMDDFAIESLRRARRSIEDGGDADEISPVTVKSRGGESVVRHDEQPLKSDIAKIPSLKPAFSENGTVTAANSSSISDGAAALILCEDRVWKSRSLRPMARIVAQASHARAPEDFTVAPGGAIAKVLDAAGWSVADVDLFEINEAFAVVALAAMREHGISHDKVNVRGGACAIGHPVGASGARIVVTLLAAMRAHGLRRGVAAICIGGGEATALALEAADD